MKNAVILHGTKFSPDDPTTNGNWFQWLKLQLEEKGYKVWLPELPRPELPNPERYTDFLFDNWEFNEESLIVGHSSGATAGLWILEKLPNDKKVKQLICVAPFYTNLDGMAELKDIGDHKYDWEKIKNSAEKITVIYSDNDPYIDVSESKDIINKIGAEEVMIEGQKHFSLGYGPKYKKFPELLKYINE